MKNDTAGRIPDSRGGRHRSLLTAVLLAAVVFALSLLYADNACPWGDDFAAYITEGIAIADGRLEEQTALNVVMHPSELPDEAGNTLLYAWGYPLLLSIIYKAVGFSAPEYAQLVLYKLPSVVCLALSAPVLYLLFRRRFSDRPAAYAALLVCLSTEFLNHINTLYSDVVFLFFACLTFWLADSFYDAGSRRKKLIYGILLGLSLWYTRETRLNGGLVCAAVLIGQLFRFDFKHRPGRSGLALQALPWALFALLCLVSEALLGRATSNASDLSGVTFSLIWGNISGYAGAVCTWLNGLWSSAFFGLLYSVMSRLFGISYDALMPLVRTVTAVWLLLSLIGAVSRIRQDGHILLYSAALFFGTCALPYTQGTRYIYTCLPFVILFGCCGLKTVLDFSRHQRGKPVLLPEKWKSGILLLAAACLLAYTGLYVRNHRAEAVSGETVITDNWLLETNAYSDAARDMYNYIIENTPEDAVIGFFKPRLLYLNTGRVGIETGVNGHSLDEVGYLLYYTPPAAVSVPEGFTLLYENTEMALYIQD